MAGRDRERQRESEFLRILTVETREELTKADGKAGLVLSCLGVALAALLAALGTGQLTPQQYPLLPRVIFWAGCASCVPAVILLGLAIAPRPGRPRRSRGHYFADVGASSTAGSLGERLRRTDLRERDLDQIVRLSRIVIVKYRCVQYGMLCSAAFVLLTVAAVTLGVLVRPR